MSAAANSTPLNDTLDWHNVRNLSRMIQHVRHVVRQDADFVWIIDGRERRGKSTLAYQMAHALDDNFSLDRCVYSGGQAITAAEEAPPYSVIWLDEAIHGGNARKAMGTENIELMDFFTVCGEYNLIYLVLYPNIWWFDPNIRDHRAHAWTHVSQRGIADVHYPNRSRFSKKTFWQQMFPSDFDPIEGPGWDAYKERKKEFVSETGRQYGHAHGGPEDERAQLLERIKTERDPWLDGVAREMINWTPPDPGPGGYKKKERRIYGDLVA